MDGKLHDQFRLDVLQGGAGTSTNMNANEVIANRALELMGHRKGAYWYGSRLSIEEARQLVPHNNATSLQVTVAVLSGMIWAIENPRAGVVEADHLDHARIMEISRPYLGEVVGEYSDWNPLVDRGVLFPEAVDEADPWQFKNFRVA